jgi:hypothetical protein
MTSREKAYLLRDSYQAISEHPTIDAVGVARHMYEAMRVAQPKTVSFRVLPRAPPEKGNVCQIVCLGPLPV